MLRYLRSRIGSSYEIKNDDLDDFVSHTKISTHGFPQKISCFDVDDKIGLLAVGTKDGRLHVYRPNGSQIMATLENNLSIAAIYFVPGNNILILLCNDIPRKGATQQQYFYKCQILTDHIHFTQLKHEIQLKRITVCEVLSRNEDADSPALLTGTNIGNIYRLLVNNMELVEYLIFQDTSLNNVPELNSQKERSISSICVQPKESSKLFLLFNRSILLYYDKNDDIVLKNFVSTSNITYISFCCTNNALLCSYQDGTYSLLKPADGVDESRRPYGDLKCSKIKKILSSKSEKNGENFTIFSGGVPEELADRDTISIFSADKSLILDLDSALLDFKICMEGVAASVLFILCEEELVAIDLRDALWRMLPLPYLNPIHASPITCISAISGLTNQTAALLTRIAKEQQNSSKIYSKNKWPLERVKKDKKSQKELSLIITGHENGTVNIWLANDLQFRLWISYNTARDFEGYKEEEESLTTQNENELGDGVPNEILNNLPPIRKAGLFDPFSDDERLCIQRLCFDPKTGQFAIGGQAGQLLVYGGLIRNTTASANELLLLDMTKSSSPGEFEVKLQRGSAIKPRSKQITYSAGFYLLNSTIAQFKPPVPVSAIAWDSSTGMLAAGNEFGYVICSVPKREVLLVRTLLASDDLIEISNKDTALSRFKSVKKSIRQSFRRKKRPNPNEPEQERQAQIFHGNEREIAPRKLNPNALDGETPNSLIKTLSFKTCNLSHSHSANMRPQTSLKHLFVGTHGGRVLIHSLCQLDGEAISPADQCPLVKEIRLNHHAPIVAIECMQQSSVNAQLFIFSEEQIRSYVLPSLKPSNFKCRLTAMEGSRIRKFVITQLNSRVRRIRNPERFLAVTTNRGEVFLISPSNPRKPYKIQFTQSNDSAGIALSTITHDGQLFHLKAGGSEFDRCSLSGMPPTMSKAN